MGLFKKSQQQDVVAKHRENSDATFSLFNETLNTLTQAEEEINADIENAENEAKQALERAKQLEDIKDKGSKFRANLTKIINGTI
jgi:hypothetical protein